MIEDMRSYMPPCLSSGSKLNAFSQLFGNDYNSAFMKSYMQLIKDDVLSYYSH